MQIWNILESFYLVKFYQISNFEVLIKLGTLI